MPVIFVHGCNVHYQDTLKPLRHTLVFLHGAGGSHHTWRDQWAGLKGTARLVIPDLPGHAESAGAARESVRGYAAWLAEFLREIGLKSFVLVGHSLGGAIALQAALDKPAGLEALILVGTGARLKMSPLILEGISSRFREFAPDLVDWMMAKASGSVLRDDITADVLSTPPAAFLADFESLNGFDVMDRLGGIGVPTLVITGDDDRLTPLKYGEYLAKNIRGAVLKIVHDAGHVVMLEKPTEVNNVVASFVHSLD